MSAYEAVHPERRCIERSRNEPKGNRHQDIILSVQTEIEFKKMVMKI